MGKNPYLLPNKVMLLFERLQNIFLLCYLKDSEHNFVIIIVHTTFNLDNHIQSEAKIINEMHKLK